MASYIALKIPFDVMFKKQNKKAWEEGTPKSVEQEKTEKGIVLITFKLLITCLKRMFYFLLI